LLHTNLYLCACLQSVDKRVKALEAQVDSVNASASSSDDRVTNLAAKYKAVHEAVHVSISVYMYFYLCV